MIWLAPFLVALSSSSVRQPLSRTVNSHRIQHKLPVLGGDPTEILRVERTGGAYFWHGKKVRIFHEMKKAGWTAVRLRLWVHPTDPWCSLNYCLILGKRAHAAGLKVILDLHYSDTWADPHHQITPIEWSHLPLKGLADKVTTYTRHVVSTFIQNGVPIYGVEFGNEIRRGMLWPLGKLTGDVPSQWLNLTTLVKAGMKGMEEAHSHTKIYRIIHIDTGGNNAESRLFVRRFRQYGVHFDVLGLSYYSWWHGPLAAMKANINDLAKRYPYKILIAETAWPYTLPKPGESGTLFGSATNLIPGYPATPQGQAKWLKTVTNSVLECGKGWGVLYWAPLWIETKTWPNNWWNLALADRKGNLLPGFWVWK